MNNKLTGIIHKETRGRICKNKEIEQIRNEQGQYTRNKV